VACASQPLGCGPKSRWDLKAARGAAPVVVPVGRWHGAWPGLMAHAAVGQAGKER